MKKLLAAGIVLAFSLFCVSAQVLDKSQTKNTSWAGFGSPVDGSPSFYGFTNTFQTRYDMGQFTLEAMLNWSLLANYDNEGNVDNFRFGTSNLNPLSLKYGTRGDSRWAGTNTNNYLKDNRANVSNTIQDSYYVNFIWHPLKNFDVGVGTKLNWQAGPAPRYGTWLWEHDAHIRQGGFSTSYDDRAGSVTQTSSESTGSYRFRVDKPGSADVTGFVHYANRYAKRAIGVRYNYAASNGMKFQLGAAFPNGFNTDDPAVNFGFQFAPVNWISICTALEGAFNEGSNFYGGAVIGAKNFILSLYAAFDSLFTDEKEDEAYGTGASISFTVPGTKISLVPEIGFNFFEKSDYSMAWYAGGTLSVPVTKQIAFNLWASFASGSKDKTWAENNWSKDWNGGSILNLRPELTFEASKRTSFSVYFDYENRTSFDRVSRQCWASGVFMTYIL